MATATPHAFRRFLKEAKSEAALTDAAEKMLYRSMRQMSDRKCPGCHRDLRAGAELDPLNAADRRLVTTHAETCKSLRTAVSWSSI